MNSLCEIKSNDTIQNIFKHRKEKVKYKIIGKVFDWPYSIRQAKWHIRTFLQKDLDSPFSCLSFRDPVKRHLLDFKGSKNLGKLCICFKGMGKKLCMQVFLK